MVESVRGRNKEQRARLLLGYQVADSVSRLHPLIHPRICYLSSMGRKILPLITDFDPKNSCGVGWGELAGFLDNRGSGCCWRVSSRPDRQSEPDLRPQDSSPSQSPSCSSTRFVRKEKIFLIRFVDCCHAKQLRGVGDCVSWVDNVTVDNRRHQGKFGSWPEFLQRLIVSLCCHGSTILRVHVAGNPVIVPPLLLLDKIVLIIVF